MTTPRRGLVLLMLPLTLCPALLAAQVSKAWSECRGDSLVTWNCARYYSGTVTLASTLKGSGVNGARSVSVTATTGRVTCGMKSTEAGEY